MTNSLEPGRNHPQGDEPEAGTNPDFPHPASGSLNGNAGVPFEEAQAVNAEPHAAPDLRAVTAWKPEDTANFLAAAIREAQRPYTEAIRRRGVPSGIVALVIMVFLVFMAGLYYQIFRVDQRLQQEAKVAAEATAAVKTAELKAAKENLPLLAQLEELKLKAKREAARADKAVEEAGKTRREKLELREALAAERIRYEKTEAKLKAALAKAEKLAAKLAALEQEQEQVESAKSMINAAEAEAEKNRQASDLLQKQIDAQTESEAALRKQLDAARELIKALQQKGGAGQQ